MKQIKVSISLTISLSTEISVPDNCDVDMLRALAKDKLPMIPKDWVIDDYEVVRDE